MRKRKYPTVGFMLVILAAASACKKVAPLEGQTMEMRPVGAFFAALPSLSFQSSAQAPLGKGCGSGLTQDSDVGPCVTILGVLVKSEANVQHTCVTLPAGKTDKDMNFQGEMANATSPGQFGPCADPSLGGACAVGWSRFETTEYYPDTHKMCGRFKNWSDTTDRVMRFTVWEK
jgi:hypothetical protein